MPDLKETLNGIIREGTSFAAQELAGLLEDAKKDPERLIREQGEMLELYILKLAQGIISKDEFKDLVQGLVDLRRIKEAMMSVDAKARAERISGRFRDLVLGALFKALKT